MNFAKRVAKANSWIAGLEAKERARTGVESLKIRYNQVFGYYIELTKSNLGKVPPDYIRKQTLANAERFMTAELKELEERVTGADAKLTATGTSSFRTIAGHDWQRRRLVYKKSADGWPLSMFLPPLRKPPP